MLRTYAYVRTSFWAQQVTVLDAQFPEQILLEQVVACTHQIDWSPSTNASGEFAFL